MWCFSTVFFWDTRPPKTAAHLDKKKDEPANPMGVPNTFKHLDLTWKPHLKASIPLNNLAMSQTMLPALSEIPI
jgi:hypothetical protein